jgi:N-acetyl-anhydromuramyl-L-alanine amidase AmpD
MATSPHDPAHNGISSEVDRRTLFKVGMGAAVAAVVGTELATAAPAGATPSTKFPWIIDCDSWDARPPNGTIEITGNTTNKIILHHMDFPNSTDYSRAHAIALAQQCQDLHMDTNGWIDTGQHFTVSRGGYVLEGRHQSLSTLDAGQHQVVAAHCPGENGNAIGIENEGTYITEVPPAALIYSLVQLCVAVCDQFRLNPWDIFGHWDFSTTDCPGIAFYKEFPSVRSQVADAMSIAKTSIPARRWPDIWKYVESPVVMTGQYLLLAKGYSVTPSGTFDTATSNAVASFQSSHGIAVDPDNTFTLPTWEALVPTLAPGATGNAVKGLQSILNHKGYSVSVTGTYDSASQTAVKSMQTLHGLSATGTVDVTTWCAVTGGSVKQAFKY